MPQPPALAFPTNAEYWYFNGTALQSSFWNISTFGGSRFGLPTLRGQNYAVPYRAGQSWRGKYPDSRTISLTMWADGSASNGQAWPATDNRLAFNDNIQTLRALFFARNHGGSTQGSLQRNWYLTQGTPKLVTSTALAELGGSIDLTMQSRFDAAFSVDLVLADPYFYGALQTVPVTTSGTLTNLGEGVVGEGFSSSVNTFTIAITQSCTITNTALTPHVFVTYAANGTETWPVTLDILNNTAFDAAGANQISAVTHGGARMWMALVNGANTITVSGGTATFNWNPPYI